MDTSLFKFFLFAAIVQCFYSSDTSKNNVNSSPPSLSAIIEEQQKESDLEKQEQQQREKATFRDKVMTSTSTGSESVTHAKNSTKIMPTMVPKNNTAKLNINEQSTAIEVEVEVRCQIITLIRITHFCPFVSQVRTQNL
jgi:hypothetical protein